MIATLEQVTRPFEFKGFDRDKRTFTGLAATWDLDLDGEMIQKGAFAKTLSEREASGRVIKLMDQHNYSTTTLSSIGRMIEARETDEGLESKYSVVKSASGDEYLARIEDKIIDALSIGFETIRAVPEDQEIDGETIKVRVIKEVKLHEVSLVNFPAQLNARIKTAVLRAHLRSLLGRELTDVERKELESVQTEIAALLVVPEAKGIAPESETRKKLEAEWQRVSRARSIAA